MHGYGGQNYVFLKIGKIKCLEKNCVFSDFSEKNGEKREKKKRFYPKLYIFYAFDKSNSFNPFFLQQIITNMLRS